MDSSLALFALTGSSFGEDSTRVASHLKVNRLMVEIII